MQHYEPTIHETIDDLSDLITWLDTYCDRVVKYNINQEEDDDTSSDSEDEVDEQQQDAQLLLQGDNPTSLLGYDFLLIGSKALGYYWHEHQQNNQERISFDKCSSPWRRQLMKNWVSDRFEKEESDWDLICMNKNALVSLLRNYEFNNVSVNYLVKEKLKRDDLDSYSSDTFMDWYNKGGQPKRWNEISLRLEKFDGTIIEVEYCTHRTHLLNYLNAQQTVVELVNVPFSTASNDDRVPTLKCGRAPLQLLEIIKRSHLYFNIESTNWLKHIFDIELIHLIQQKLTDVYHDIDLYTADQANDLPGLVYFDRLTKRIVKHDKDEGGGELCHYIERYAISPVDEISDVVNSVNTEILSTAFSVSLLYLNPSYLGSSTESLEFISQQIAGRILHQTSHTPTSKELEKMVFKTVQYAMDRNVDTYLFSIIRDYFFEISERTFKMLDKPQVFEQLFETKTELKQIRFTNTPIDFINDEVKDVSNFCGASLCGKYCSIEIVMKIVSFSSKASDIVKFAQLDKSWNAIFQSEDVWKYLYYSRWPTPSHYTNAKSNAQVSNWKQHVLQRSKLTTLELPTMKGMEGLSNIFKAKFIGQTELFNQFIHDFYSNTYIVKKRIENDTSNEYNTLNVLLCTYWPRQNPLIFDLEIKIDYAWYRSGDSKWGGREKVNITLHGKKQSSYNHFRGSITSIKQFTNPEELVGSFYLDNLKQNQYAPLFLTLLVLGFGKEWTIEVLGTSWF